MRCKRSRRRKIRAARPRQFVQRWIRAAEVKDIEVRPRTLPRTQSLRVFPPAARNMRSPNPSIEETKVDRSSTKDVVLSRTGTTLVPLNSGNSIRSIVAH